MIVREIFKNANLTSIRSILKEIAGSKVPNLEAFPKSYVTSNTPSDQWAQIEFQYSDFQEAFCGYNLIARSCHKYNYYPELFNVYNKIVVKLYSTTDGLDSGPKTLTMQDLYFSYFIT